MQRSETFSDELDTELLTALTGGEPLLTVGELCLSHEPCSGAQPPQHGVGTLHSRAHWDTTDVPDVRKRLV